MRHMSHKHRPEHLTRREREIMNAVFALGNRASSEDIRARLHAAPSDSSVRGMLARRAKKRVRKRQQHCRRYLYSATTAEADAKRTALQQVVHTFFGGSLTSMMAARVSDGSWSDDELAKLKAEIDRVRKDGKSGRKP